MMACKIYTLLKAKAAQVGEIRHRKNGPHQKQQSGKWIKVKQVNGKWVPDAGKKKTVSKKKKPAIKKHRKGSKVVVKEGSHKGKIGKIHEYNKENDTYTIKTPKKTMYAGGVPITGHDMIMGFKHEHLEKPSAKGELHIDALIKKLHGRARKFSHDDVTRIIKASESFNLGTTQRNLRKLEEKGLIQIPKVVNTGENAHNYVIATKDNSGKAKRIILEYRGGKFGMFPPDESISKGQEWKESGYKSAFKETSKQQMDRLSEKVKKLAKKHAKKAKVVIKKDPKGPSRKPIDDFAKKLEERTTEEEATRIEEGIKSGKIKDPGSHVRSLPKKLREMQKRADKSLIEGGYEEARKIAEDNNLKITEKRAIVSVSDQHGNKYEIKQESQAGNNWVMYKKRPGRKVKIKMSDTAIIKPQIMDIISRNKLLNNAESKVEKAGKSETVNYGPDKKNLFKTNVMPKGKSAFGVKSVFDSSKAFSEVLLPKDDSVNSGIISDGKMALHVKYLSDKDREHVKHEIGNENSKEVDIDKVMDGISHTKSIQMVGTGVDSSGNVNQTVFHSPENDSYSYFDSRYIQMFQKMSGKGGISLLQRNSMSPAMILDSKGDMMGVLMPMQVSHDTPEGMKKFKAVAGVTLPGKEKKEEKAPEIPKDVESKGGNYKEKYKDLTEQGSDYTTKEMTKKRSLPAIKKIMGEALAYKTGRFLHRQPELGSSLFAMEHLGGNKWNVLRDSIPIETNVTINNARDAWIYMNMGKTPTPDQWKTYKSYAPESKDSFVQKLGKEDSSAAADSLAKQEAAHRKKKSKGGFFRESGSGIPPRKKVGKRG